MCHAAVLLLSLVLSGAGAAQTASWHPTTISSIRQFPSFFHLQNVIVRGELVEAAVGLILQANGRRLDVELHDLRAPTGPIEVRGQLLDVGRLEPGDPRLTGYLPPEPDRWPQRGELLLLNVNNIIEAEPAVRASPRVLALEPWRFDDEPVLVIGQFRGRNLYGDLPGAPAMSEHDFVLRAAGGAIWVTGLKPSGRNFDLRVIARVDTGQWVEVTGIVRRVRGLVTLEGTDITLASPVADDEPPPAAASPPPPPASVVFSIPTSGETAISREITVRLQFSRGLDTNTLDGNIRVRNGEPGAPALELATTYDAGRNSIAIILPGPLAPFSQVVVDTFDGLMTFDGIPVAPFTLTFTTGQ
jgi:hypothetical protein